MQEIKWQDWNRETFEKSKSERKPILLDIYGSWCHWCHVMDRTSYSDPPVIDLINKNFIPVRVDTDKRPDVNRRYNMGGWPSTVFLDSEGKVITGGTYIPPPKMREVLRSVIDLYNKAGGRVRSKLGPTILPQPSGEELSEKLVRDISTSIAVNFDIDYGGFGFEPKFPHTDALELALVRYYYNDEKEMMTVASKTLEKMAAGGMYDHEEDGFFRYSTTRDWSIPHYEKMAEDNAKLLTVYLHAYQLTGNKNYRETAEGIIRYVDSHLRDKTKPGFYGSQDADEEYYALDLEKRKKHKAPGIDRTKYTNYNALFVSSYLLAGHVLKRPELEEFANNALDNLLADRVTTDGAVVHYDQSDAPKGLLIDQALLIHALLDMYEYTGNRKYVDSASRLADYTLRSLGDPKDGGFFDIPESTGEIGELKTRDKPIDENSALSTALVRLSHSTSNHEMWGEIVGKTLKLFTADYDRYGVMAASYALALDMYLKGPIGVTIIGSERDKAYRSFKQEALDVYDMRRSILYLDPANDSNRIKDLGFDSTVKTTTVAYACVGKVCGPPIKEPGKLEASIELLLKPKKTASMAVPTQS